jgi:hypothetical protein
LAISVSPSIRHRFLVHAIALMDFIRSFHPYKAYTPLIMKGKQNIFIHNGIVYLRPVQFAHRFAPITVFRDLMVDLRH